MTQDFSQLFLKAESHAYQVRDTHIPLATAVIRSLYEFIEVENAGIGDGAPDESGVLDERTFEKIRNQVTKKLKGTPLRNIELVMAYRKMVADGALPANEEVLSLIMKKKIRTLSGIANITVLMKEYGCPGKCVFCPTQPGMPKSYFSTQPAMMRAVRNHFDAYSQVKARLNGLFAQGHDTTKIDIRTAGGTWSAYSRDYQEEFVKGIFFINSVE